MNLPKFSVITVSYNQGEFIRQTIESVLAQNYSNFEHIVIDGGSTDNTLEILASYPHLKWTSEPDRGQSHALNKGFARATGDVIAWINSDDWYAPGTFHTVAQHIDAHPIVLGGCVVTDKVGTPKEDVPNLERSWFDTAKYWVYHSVPTQPGIFFRRDALESVAIREGEFVDEELFFTMDFDLWLRMQERYPFSFRVPRVFSYVRTYDTAKTGSDMAGCYREMSRVFRRHSARKIKQEQIFSFVVPLDGTQHSIEPFLAAVANQSVKQIEVVFADSASDPAVVRANRRKISQLGASFQTLALRYVSAPSELNDARHTAIDVGIAAATAPVTACIRMRDALPSDFVMRALQLFSRDNIGLLLTSLRDEVKAKLFSPVGNGIAFNPVGPFKANLHDLEFVVRTVAWLDCRQSTPSALTQVDPELLWKRLLLMMAHKAWSVIGEQLLSPLEARTQEEDAPFRLYSNSLVIHEIGADLRQDLFTGLRAKNGFAIVIPDELLQAADGIVSRIPPELPVAHVSGSHERLERFAMSYPEFGPARFILARELEKGGRLDDARREFERWRTIHENERVSPLFGP